MIHAFRITNYTGDSIRLQLDDPWESGFIVKNVEGLGPVKANIQITEMATNDGGISNSARLETRNIVFHLQFLESPTIEETRHLSYLYFPIKKKITIVVETDRDECEIEGTVESNEPDIFSQEEGCTISVLCPDPYFHSTKEQINVFNGVEPLFEFPFENDSTTEKLIEFGEILNYQERVLRYEGDGNPGIVITIHILGPFKNLKLYNTDAREYMSLDQDKILKIIETSPPVFDPNRQYINWYPDETQTETSVSSETEEPIPPVGAGDEIIINTNRGNKSILFIRDGIIYDIINALNRPISWFYLRKGNNTFSYGCDEGVSNIQLKITNKILYNGV